VIDELKGLGIIVNSLFMHDDWGSNHRPVEQPLGMIHRYIDAAVADRRTKPPILVRTMNGIAIVVIHRKGYIGHVIVRPPASALPHASTEL
jgi:hypothetical protein